MPDIYIYFDFLNIQDTNECLDDTRCQHGCENMIGGYRCACPEGFRRHYYWNQCVGKCACCFINLSIPFFLQ